MSKESSVSETTPLRRPERESLEDVTTSTTTTTTTTTIPIQQNNVAYINDISHITAVPNNVNSTKQNISSNRQSLKSGVHLNQQQHTTSSITTSNSTTTINNINGNYNNLNHNNNNNRNNNKNNYNNNILSENQNLTIIEMDTNKRILCRIGLDVLILLCVGFPILCFFLWGDAYQRGFFCDDESLKHPFHDSTVKNWMLYIIGLVIPVGTILIVEIIQSKNNAKHSNTNPMARRYVFMNYEIPDWLIECYKKIGIFGFGAAVSQLTTDIAKYSIGRLRPHFFTVCQPILADGSTCADPKNAGIYIENFRCAGIGSSEKMLKEMRLSFPSGHSSFTFFTMVYIALYLQARMTWNGSKLLRHFLQFLFIMTAWYTALSRVSDYKHHWSDVLAGSAVGSICAVVVAKYVSDLFPTTQEKIYVLPKTNHDLTSSQTRPSNGH